MEVGSTFGSWELWSWELTVFLPTGVYYSMLEARSLTKFYSAIPAVKDLSFTLGPGGVVGLLGPNGSGKSTTVSILAGLLEPSGGFVLLDGQDVYRTPLEYKSKVGYVPE